MRIAVPVRMWTSFCLPLCSACLFLVSSPSVWPPSLPVPKSGYLSLNHIFESSYATRQCLFLLLAPLVSGVIIAMAIPYGILRQRAELFYWIAFILLTVTTVFNRAQGVKAWLDIIWGYTIQPSEFAKLAMILILAKNLSKQDRPLADSVLCSYFLMKVLIPGFVILLEGETGSLLVIIFLFAVMMYFSNVSMKTLQHPGRVAILGILSVYGFMVATGSTDYRLARIAGWLNPEMYASDDAYQQTMSKMTIGSGGMYGNGMFRDGAISQLNYVPRGLDGLHYSTIGGNLGLRQARCRACGLYFDPSAHALSRLVYPRQVRPPHLTSAASWACSFSMSWKTSP